MHLQDESASRDAFGPMPEKLRRFHEEKLRIKKQYAYQLLLLSFSFSFSCEIYIFIL